MRRNENVFCYHNIAASRWHANWCLNCTQRVCVLNDNGWQCSFERARSHARNRRRRRQKIVLEQYRRDAPLSQCLSPHAVTAAQYVYIMRCVTFNSLYPRSKQKNKDTIYNLISCIFGRWYRIKCCTRHAYENVKKKKEKKRRTILRRCALKDWSRRLISPQFAEQPDGDYARQHAEKISSKMKIGATIVPYGEPWFTDSFRTLCAGETLSRVKIM